MKVGFIGLGRMGRAMSRSLLRGGHDVVVYNRTPEKAAELAEAGARVARSIAEACEGSEAVMTMVANDEALEEVTSQLRESLPAGTVPVAMGTHGGDDEIRQRALEYVSGFNAADPAKISDKTVALTIGIQPEWS